MRESLIVGAGGAVGAVLRYLAGKIPIGSFPVKTFLVNLPGFFLIGW
ncbi:MAG: hypothetical protein IIZ18_07470 [Ruminococcus sp.]|nr:hypothetical protein [Ruminococcus sp.]